MWEAVEVNITGLRERRCITKPPGRPLPPGPLGSKSPSLLSLTPSQRSAFNAVGPFNGTPAKVTCCGNAIDLEYPVIIRKCIA